MNPSLAHRLTNGAKEVLTAPRPKYGRLDPERAKEALLLVKQVFDRHQVPFWLIYGTLLGAYRDGGFIPWDKDIDLACCQTDEERIYPAVLELQERGFDVVRTNADDTYFQLRRRTVYLDFAVLVREGALWRADRFTTPDYFSALKDFPFLGTTFLIPEDTEGYLTHYYGPTWRVPDPTCKTAKMDKIRRKA